MIRIWRFPQMRIPLNHPFNFRIFHFFSPPVWGWPMTLEAPKYISGWWFGTFFIFPCIRNVIIPTDELYHFSDGWLNHQPDILCCYYGPRCFRRRMIPRFHVLGNCFWNCRCHPQLAGRLETNPLVSGYKWTITIRGTNSYFTLWLFNLT